MVIPEIVFVAFQRRSPRLPAAWSSAAFAERIKFSAVLVFVVLWFTFAYTPIAHMVWYWDGPGRDHRPKSVDARHRRAGWLWQKGALDFAGGTVVHINAGVAGLVGAYLIGKRIGYGKESMPPHNLPLTMIGACLLWVGWFGFNAGSNLEATGNSAAIAFLNTIVATAMAVLAWLMVESLRAARPGPRRGIGRGRRAGRDHSGVRFRRPDRRASDRPGRWGGLVLGRERLQEHARRGRFAGCVRRARRCGILGALLTGVFAAPELGGPASND